MNWFTHIYCQETADNSDSAGHILTLGPYPLLRLAKQAAEVHCNPGSGLAACVSPCSVWSSKLALLEDNYYYCDQNACDQCNYESTQPVWQS